MTAIKETEADFQRWVVDAAHHFGWRVVHFRPARTKSGWATPVAYDAAGFPDLVLVHPRLGLLFAEIKTSSGRLRPEQTEWQDLLIEAGATACVFRPKHRVGIVSLLRTGPKGLAHTMGVM